MTKKRSIKFYILLILLSFSIGVPSLSYAWGIFAKPLVKNAIKGVIKNEGRDAAKGLGYGVGSAYIYDGIRQDIPFNRNGYQPSNPYDYPIDRDYLNQQRESIRNKYGFYPY